MTEPILQIDKFGTQCWCLNGKLHRENGPAIILPDGTKEWYLNGLLHRENGPAVESNKAWYKNGKRHREDGPAIEFPDGTKEWWLNGKLIAEGEHPENWDELIVLAQIEQVMNE